MNANKFTALVELTLQLNIPDRISEIITDDAYQMLVHERKISLHVDLYRFFIRRSFDQMINQFQSIYFADFLQTLNIIPEVFISDGNNI